MSYGAVEQLFYDVSTSRNRKEAFREDAGEVAGKYALSETEREMVISMQVENLFEYGINPMLLMGFWTSVRGPQSMPEYLARVPKLASRLEASSGGKDSM